MLIVRTSVVKRASAQTRVVRARTLGAMPPPPFFHEESQEVRFYVLIDGEFVGASVGRATLHYLYCPTASGENPMDTYVAQAAGIEAAVRRRVASGSLKPVMLRERDLRS